mgnify:CR=1 FL=1
MPDISVIVPTFNRATTLPRAIQSVLNQTFTPVEIIVVDDGSTDNTQKLVEENFPSVHYIFQKNQGVSSARNTGIKQTKGEWPAFLDSDDEWLPAKLEKQIKALKKHSKTGTNKNFQLEYLICHTNETWIRNGKRVNQKKKHQKFGGFIYQKCLPLCVISPSSVIIHRSVFEDVGLFDESLPACEDYDLWLRICAKYPVLYLEEPLINKYGGHADQLSQSIWGLDRYRIMALEKSIESNMLNEEDYLAAQNMLIEKLEIFIQGAEKRGNLENTKYYMEKLEIINSKFKMNRT